MSDSRLDVAFASLREAIVPVARPDLAAIHRRARRRQRRRTAVSLTVVVFAIVGIVAAASLVSNRPTGRSTSGSSPSSAPSPSSGSYGEPLTLDIAAGKLRQVVNLDRGGLVAVPPLAGADPAVPESLAAAAFSRSLAGQATGLTVGLAVVTVRRDLASRGAPASRSTNC